MAYYITPDLGLELADPLTVQAFETVNVNSNFELLEAGIVADRVRLTAAEVITTAYSAGVGRGNLAREVTASPATLTAIADPLVGDKVRVTAPGTGIEPFWAECFAGPGAATADWRPIELVVSDTKAHLDTFIAAWIADTDLTFVVGALALVTGTNVIYRFTTTAGVMVIAGAEVDLTPTSATASVGSAPIGTTGRVDFTGITTGGTLRVNCDKTTLALFTRIHLLIDVEAGTAGQTVTFILRLADGATVNSAAASYTENGSLTSAGVHSALAPAATTSWGIGAPRRYQKGFRWEFSDFPIAHETTASFKGNAHDIGQTNLTVINGGMAGHTSATLAADGVEFTFTLTGGASASGTIRVIGEL